jgi:hypothetical protein
MLAAYILWKNTSIALEGNCAFCTDIAFSSSARRFKGQLRTNRLNFDLERA